MFRSRIYVLWFMCEEEACQDGVPKVVRIFDWKMQDQIGSWMKAAVPLSLPYWIYPTLSTLTHLNSNFSRLRNEILDFRRTRPTHCDCTSPWPSHAAADTNGRSRCRTVRSSPSADTRRSRAVAGRIRCSCRSARCSIRWSTGCSFWWSAWSGALGWSAEDGEEEEKKRRLVALVTIGFVWWTSSSII